MYYHKSPDLIRLLFICLSSILFTILIIFIYTGTIDDFVPKHIAVSIANLRGYSFSPTYEYLYNLFPGFYTYVSIILLLTGILYEQLPFTPIILWPYICLFFSMIYLFSNRNTYLAILLTTFTFTASTVGTYKVFLWPHGLGEIIYFSLIIIIFLNRLNEPEFRILISLLVLMLPFMSYNLTFSSLLFLAMLSILLQLLQINSNISINLNSKLLISIISLLLITELGIVKFIYKAFIPILKICVEDSYTMQNAFDVFAKSFLQNPLYNENPLINSLLISVPIEITYIYIIKYLIYLTIIFVATVLLYTNWPNIHNTKEYILGFIFLSVLITTLIYMFLRLVIGHFTLVQLFFPFIFSIVLVTVIKPKTKCIIYFTIILLIISNLLVIYISSSDNIIQKDSYDYILTSSSWISEHVLDDNIYTPDQLTYGWCFLQLNYLKSPLKVYYLDIDQVLNIYFSSPLSTTGITIVNYRLNYNQIGKWYTSEPFEPLRSIVESNPSFKCKIYEYNKDIAMFITG